MKKYTEKDLEGYDRLIDIIHNNPTEDLIIIETKKIIIELLKGDNGFISKIKKNNN